MVETGSERSTGSNSTFCSSYGLPVVAEEEKVLLNSSASLRVEMVEDSRYAMPT